MKGMSCDWSSGHYVTGRGPVQYSVATNNLSSTRRYPSISRVGLKGRRRSRECRTIFISDKARRSTDSKKASAPHNSKTRKSERQRRNFRPRFGSPSLHRHLGRPRTTIIVLPHLPRAKHRRSLLAYLCCWCRYRHISVLGRVSCNHGCSARPRAPPTDSRDRNTLYGILECTGEVWEHCDTGTYVMGARAAIPECVGKNCSTVVG
ncbi:hypothetical protein HD554DRAFT_1232662 [Boletus coccyginus]|nr:hypothetical protein HD554DRAFT_1232662 [Boletus coccyginus]